MAKIVDEWDVTGKGDYVLTLDSPIPKGFFTKYRIEGNDYPIVPVHFSNVNSLSVIGVKSTFKCDFIGKNVEFVNV